nr:unnamed protein product [Callosobruchus chinensis]
MASEMSALMNMLEEIKKENEQQAAEMKEQAEQTRANMQRTVVELEANLKQQQAEAVAELEEQRQAVSQALENQDQRISAIETSQKHVEEQLETTQKHVEEQLQQVKDHLNEMLRELSTVERSFVAAAPAFLDRHNRIALMNNWSNEEKACVLTLMLRDSAAGILENISSSDLHDYGKITSALNLRFENAHLTELLYGQLHNRAQQAKEDLTTFAYEVQRLAKRAFVNSPIETQEYVAARQDIKNLPKRNEEIIAKIEQQHEAAIKNLTGKHDRETAVLKGEIRRLKEEQEKFIADGDRDTKNLRKKSEQYEAALRKLDEKLDIEVAALKNEIKRLEDLDQLKKAESECAQVKDENATLRQMVAQLEAESASKNKNDNTTAEPEKARIKEDKLKLRVRLAQLEAENKKLKSDLSNALDDAKKSTADLTRAKDVDNKMEQLPANLENENGRLKKELEKALAGSSGKKQSKDEINKMKQKIAQMESEIGRLEKELNKVIEDAQKSVSGISVK